MKIKITVLLAIVVLASCSAPKYAYYFDHHNYHAGKKQNVTVQERASIAVDPQTLVASTSNEPIITVEKAGKSSVNPGEVKKTYLQMNKSERKAVRHQIKSDIKTYVASKKKTDSTQATHAGMDNDLKLAIIFGAIGIVAFLIGGNVFQVIGAIAMIIGVVFFVKWIVRQ